ncbi:MAG: GNAT family N-acetyltransferase [Verrucomicrobia bacterium]|nr:GNAT family N-acetyltransferase [Verrucomicrobiota bacterium]
MQTQQHRLKPVTSEEDWAAYHEMRETELFHPLGVDYLKHHPDDRNPSNHPFLILADEEVVGAVRLDHRQDLNRMITRTLAIRSRRQGQGHGSAGMILCEDFARGMGCTEMCLNAHQPALPFYLHRGYRQEEWDPEDRFGSCVQCRKILTDNPEA